MPRRIMVEIVGDSSKLERAFARSAKSAQRFNQAVGASTVVRRRKEETAATKSAIAADEELIRVRSKRAAGIGPFRFAGAGLAAGLGLVAATQAVRELGASLEQTGEEAFTVQGRIKNMVAALTSGDLVGATKALIRQPETLEELGISAAYSTKQMAALQDVADGTTASLAAQAVTAGGDLRPAFERLDEIVKAAGTDNKELARQLLEARHSALVLSAGVNSLSDYMATLATGIRTATGELVAFKGAADDVAGMRGPGARLYETPYQRPGRPTRKPLSPSDRRELGLIGQEGTERLPGLRARLTELNNMLKNLHQSYQQRLKTLTNIRNTEAEIAGIVAQQSSERASRRNQFFDAKMARQLDRLQDLGLRKRLAGLKVAAQQIRDEMNARKDVTRRLNLEDQLVGILRQQRAVQEQITAAIKEANQALKDRAQAIKSAVIERLQRKQTDILNRRALADAREQLRVARQLGGPGAIRNAMRNVQDAQFAIKMAQLEAAPATLTKGGRFALGNAVTININGITDPDKVAAKVVEVLKKRQGRSTTQQRGPQAGVQN